MNLMDSLVLLVILQLFHLHNLNLYHRDLFFRRSGR